MDLTRFRTASIVAFNLEVGAAVATALLGAYGIYGYMVGLPATNLILIVTVAMQLIFVMWFVIFRDRAGKLVQSGE